MIIPHQFELDWRQFQADVIPAGTDAASVALLRVAFFSGALALASQLSYRCDAALVDLRDRVKAMGQQAGETERAFEEKGTMQ